MTDLFGDAWATVKGLERDEAILAWLRATELHPGVRQGLQAFFVTALHRVAEPRIDMGMPLSWQTSEGFPVWSLAHLVHSDGFGPHLKDEVTKFSDLPLALARYSSDARFVARIALLADPTLSWTGRLPLVESSRVGDDRTQADALIQFGRPPVRVLRDLARRIAHPTLPLGTAPASDLVRLTQESIILQDDLADALARVALSDGPIRRSLEARPRMTTETGRLLLAGARTRAQWRRTALRLVRETPAWSSGPPVEAAARARPRWWPTLRDDLLLALADHRDAEWRSRATVLAAL